MPMFRSRYREPSTNLLAEVLTQDRRQGARFSVIKPKPEMKFHFLYLIYQANSYLTFTNVVGSTDSSGDGTEGPQVAAVGGCTEGLRRQDHAASCERRCRTQGHVG